MHTPSTRSIFRWIVAACFVFGGIDPLPAYVINTPPDGDTPGATTIDIQDPSSEQSYHPPAGPSPEQIALNKAADLNNQGIAATNNREYELAIKLFQQAAQTAPEEEKIFLGNMAIAQQDLNERDANAASARGWQDMKDQNWDAAISEMRNAIRLNPSDALRDNLAYIIKRKSMIEDEQSATQQILQGIHDAAGSLENLIVFGKFRYESTHNSLCLRQVGEG